MLAKFYQNIVLKKPGLILILLLIFLCFFGYYSKNFRLDASSETLLIEGDPDLKYLNEINERYGAKEFLVLTYTPKGRMIDENSSDQISLNWGKNKLVYLDHHLCHASFGYYQSPFKNADILTIDGHGENETCYFGKARNGHIKKIDNRAVYFISIGCKNR